MSKLLFYVVIVLALDTKPAEVITSLYVAPQLQFKLEGGTVLPHDVIMCAPTRTASKFAEHDDSFIQLNCDNGVTLKLDNILFPPGKVAVKIESVHGIK